MAPIHAVNDSRRHQHEPVVAPTDGMLIRWARFYDPLIQLIALGRAGHFRLQSVALAQISAGERVLDVGCGTGELALAAQTRVGTTGQVCGIDPAPEMIAVAQRKATARDAALDLRVGVIEALPYADQSFDVVLSSLMMHHLPDATKAQGLTEIYRILRPGGRLLIVDFKRPASTIGRAAITAMLHGGLRIGVQELVTPVTAAGLAVVALGKTNIPTIGYLLAVKGAAQ